MLLIIKFKVNPFLALILTSLVIGVAAGFGMALAYLNGECLDSVADEIKSARPTAINLFCLDKSNQIKLKYNKKQKWRNKSKNVH